MLLGRLTKAHGHRGELAMEILRPWPEGLQWLHLDIDGIPVPWHVAEVRPRGTSSVLLTLDGIDSLEQATALAGKDVTIEDCDLPTTASSEDAVDDVDDDDAFYVADLIGYDLADSDGTIVGEIFDWDDSTANVLLHIRRSDGTEASVPLADDLVIDLDQERRRLTLDIPQGLL